MIRRPPRSTLSSSSAASDVYKRQGRHGLRYEDISFPSPLDGTNLRGWYMPAKRPTGRALVVVPGIDSNRLVGGISLRLAADLVGDGFDVLAFDLRDKGTSDGDTLSFGAREQYDVCLLYTSPSPRDRT